MADKIGILDIYFMVYHRSIYGQTKQFSKLSQLNQPAAIKIYIAGGNLNLTRQEKLFTFPEGMGNI